MSNANNVVNSAIDARNTNAAALVRMVKAINDWEFGNLPVPPTHTGRDLFLQLVLSQYDDRPKPLKALYWNTEHAASGLRKILRQLETDGWLTRKTSPDDLRCRILEPTDALHSLMERYHHMLANTLEDTLRQAQQRRELPVVAPGAASASGQWKILVADDEESVHQVTQVVLGDFNFDGKGLEFLHARTGAEALAQFEQHPDIAVALVDVVMESEHAGLEVVRKVREDLGNHFVRLILRTGQPGAAPEREVIARYDINDYKAKAELSSLKLYSAMMSALRGYRDIMAIDRQRRGMARLLEAMPALFRSDSINQFAEVAVDRLLALMDMNQLDIDAGHCGAFFLVDRAPDIPADRVLAASGKHAALLGTTLSVAEPGIAGFLAEVASCTADGERIALCLNSRFDERYLLYFDAGRPITAADIALADLFRLKSCATLDEIFLQRQNRQMQRHAIRTMAANALPAHSQVSGGVLKRIEEYTIAIADAVVAQRIHPELRLGEFIDFFDAFKKESSSPESGKNGTAVSQSLAARIMALACALEQMTSASPFEEPEAVVRALSKLENRAEFRRDADMLAALSEWLKNDTKRYSPTSPAISPT